MRRFGSTALLLLVVSNIRADEKRYQYLVSMLDTPITVEVEEAPLRLLLSTIEDLASPPGSDRDPQKKVKILMDEPRFKRHCNDFEVERLPPIKLPGVSLSTVLRIICDQIDAVFVVGRDFIEIVPAVSFRRDLGWPEDEEHASRSLNPLMHCHYKKLMLHEALELLADQGERSIVLSKQVPDDIAKKEITMKLANTPFPTAVEFLAASADLKVVARGDNYFVTTRRQAEEMLRKRDEPVNAPACDDLKAVNSVLVLPDHALVPDPKRTVVASRSHSLRANPSSERSKGLSAAQPIVTKLRIAKLSLGSGALSLACFLPGGAHGRQESRQESLPHVRQAFLPAEPPNFFNLMPMRSDTSGSNVFHRQLDSERVAANP